MLPLLGKIRGPVTPCSAKSVSAREKKLMSVNQAAAKAL